MTAPTHTQASVGLSRRGSDRFGKHFPNLVVIRDSGELGGQFRVQCEVDLDEATASIVEKALWGEPRTKASLEMMKKLVVAKIPKVATPVFVEIVTKAFEDQREYKMSPKP